MNDYNIKGTSTQSMKAGFTIIELVFIIVIIGILASISIGKLSATRDDAKLSADVSNMNICIIDVGSRYAATKTIDLNITSCNNVYCYTIDLNDTIMNVEINQTAKTAVSFCNDIENVGGHLAKQYQLAGQRIKR